MQNKRVRILLLIGAMDGPGCVSAVQTPITHGFPTHDGGKLPHLLRALQQAALGLGDHGIAAGIASAPASVGGGLRRNSLDMQNEQW